MQLSAPILLFGHDPGLQLTRAMLLGSMQLPAAVASTASEVARCFKATSFALLVLCHSLSDRDRKTVLSLAASLQPQLRHLDLGSDLNAAETTPLVQLLQTRRGPREFCLAVQAHALPLSPSERNTPCPKAL